MAFIETPRFPDDISYGSTGGPMFKTTVYTGYSGTEQRNITWAEARHQYEAAHGIRDRDDMDVLRAFFYNMRGRAYGFRFKDWSDYNLTDENIGTGDGVEDTFTITKTYTSGAETYVRRIYKPIASGFVVKVNNVVVNPSNYTLDDTTGTIVFDGGSEPGVGLAVTVTGEFDVPVRFDTDQMSVSHDGFQIESWTSIPLVEIRSDEV